MLRILILTMIIIFWNSVASATNKVLSLHHLEISDPECELPHPPPASRRLVTHIGDDNEDDSDCIQAWLTKAVEDGHKDLYVPPGTYLYSRVFDLPSGIHIRCAGPGSAIFKNIGPAGPFLVNREDYVEDILVENCGFDVNGGAEPFLSVISSNNQFPPTTAPNRNIRIRGNRIYDSAITGMSSVEQRQYILFTPCENCWIENNHLSEGGRIKVGIPGKRIFIRNNFLENVNDNAITVVDIAGGPSHIDSFTSSDIFIEGNVIRDPVGTGIFFGADGEDFDQPFVKTLNVHISNNVITGDWKGFCIIGTLPNITQNIHVVNNMCTKTGNTAHGSSAGIVIKRVGGALTELLPARDILVAFNTVIGDAGEEGDNPGDEPVSLDQGAIFVSGPLRDVKVIGNTVRNIGNLAILLRFREMLNVIVSDNLVSGQIQVGIPGNPLDNFNFNGTIQGNSILNSENYGIVFQAQGDDSITASVRDNIIKNPDEECVWFVGEGNFLVDRIDNEFNNCGGSGATEIFTGGATLHPDSVPPTLMITDNNIVR